MFGRKPKETVTRNREADKVVVPTVDIIRLSKPSYMQLLDRELDEDERHLERYLRVLGRQTVDSTKFLDIYFIKGSKKAGFNLFVKPDVVQQFKYAALVCGNGVSLIPPVRKDHSSSVLYVGDIPDFALDRIATAQNKGIARYITIHSNQELPVIYEKYVYRDPVLISWDVNPRIERQSGKWQCTNNDLSVGVVIAMWGDEGQPL